MRHFNSVAPAAVSATYLLLVGGGSSPTPLAATAQIRAARVSPSIPIPPDDDVIFQDSFDDGKLRGRYFEYSDGGGAFAWSPHEGLSGGAMRARFEKGQVDAGSLKVVFGKNPFGRGPRRDETFRDVWWRVYVKHEAGWEGDPAKLARLTCLASLDWTQGFIAHVWSGKNHALCIDPATGIRDSRKVTTRYNDFANLKWLGLVNGKTALFTPQESGRWVCVESHVRLNTPGKADGLFQLWTDGILEAKRTDLDWHGTWSDYGIDAFFLENYWNEGAIKREARWFDELAISTKRIGPLRTTDTPTIERTAIPVQSWQARVASEPNDGAVVWTGKPLPGEITNVRVDSRHGDFVRGDRLESGRTYWVSARQHDSAGMWGDWSPWHCPFVVTSPSQ